MDLYNYWLMEKVAGPTNINNFKKENKKAKRRLKKQQEAHQQRGRVHSSKALVPYVAPIPDSKAVLKMQHRKQKMTPAGTLFSDLQAATYKRDQAVASGAKQQREKTVKTSPKAPAAQTGARARTQARTQARMTDLERAQAEKIDKQRVKNIFSNSKTRSKDQAPPKKVVIPRERSLVETKSSLPKAGIFRRALTYLKNNPKKSALAGVLATAGAGEAFRRHRKNKNK